MDDTSVKSDSKNASEKTANREAAKSSPDKWFVGETTDGKKKNEKEEPATVKNFGETIFKSDKKELKEVSLTVQEPGKGRDCETSSAADWEEEKKQTSKKENTLDCPEKPTDGGEDSDQKSSSSEEEANVGVQKTEDNEQDVDVMKVKREREEVHDNQDSK